VSGRVTREPDRITRTNFHSLRDTTDPSNASYRLVPEDNAVRRITLLSCCGLPLLSLFVSSPVVGGQAVGKAPPPPVAQYLFCVGAASPQSAIYYSGTIVTTEKNLNPVPVAFFQFLKQQYSYKGPGDYPGDLQCTRVRTLEEARSYEQIYVNRDRQNKRNVIETGWTYNGAPPQPTPQGQDPRLAQIPEPFRRQALDEISGSKGYCLNNERISGLIDCDCFSKIVLDYRIAHAKEYNSPRGGQDTEGWLPLTNLLLGPLNCSECISDERILKWATAQTTKSVAPNYPDADKKFMTECVSRSFLANFRAKPSLG
jgi:hypothetical protein